MAKEQHASDLKRIIANIPLVGYTMRLIWQIAVLPRKQTAFNATTEQLAQATGNLENSLTSLKQQMATIDSRITESRHSSENISNQLADVKHQLLLQSLKPSGGATVKGLDSKDHELLADNHGLDKFYIDFENKFRGSEADIKQRLEVYVPYFKRFKSNYKKYPVLDIGCGRGEMLAVLKSAGIDCLGIDLNESMVKRAGERGYKATQAEALSYLMSQKNASFSAITGFHIAEHIPFDVLVRLFEECYRVLRPGGFIIFETPNPESIHVGSFSFYFDPSHLHPLPPQVLAFTLENRGFSKVDILRLHPKREDFQQREELQDDRLAELVGRFFGPQDYAVIGYK